MLYVEQIPICQNSSVGISYDSTYRVCGRMIYTIVIAHMLCHGVPLRDVPSSTMQFDAIRRKAIPCSTMSLFAMSCHAWYCIVLYVSVTHRSAFYRGATQCVCARVRMHHACDLTIRSPIVSTTKLEFQTNLECHLSGKTLLL